jgi:hypothetical protein
VSAPELTLHLYWMGDDISCGPCGIRTGYLKEVLAAVLPQYEGRVVCEEHYVKPRPNAMRFTVTEKHPTALPLLRVGQVTLRAEVPAAPQLKALIDEQLALAKSGD